MNAVIWLAILAVIGYVLVCVWTDIDTWLHAAEHELDVDELWREDDEELAA